MYKFYTRVLPGIRMGHTLDWLSVDSGYVRYSNQKGWTFRKRDSEFLSQVGRAKCCKKNSRCPPLCTKRERLQARISRNIFRRRRRSLRSESRSSVVLWRIHIWESCCSRTKLYVPKNDSLRPLILSIFRNKQKQHAILMYFKRRHRLLLKH